MAQGMMDNGTFLALGATAALGAAALVARRGSFSRVGGKVLAVKEAMDTLLGAMGTDMRTASGTNWVPGAASDPRREASIGYDPHGYLSDARIVASDIARANDNPRRARRGWLRNREIPVDLLHAAETALAAAGTPVVYKKYAKKGGSRVMVSRGWPVLNLKPGGKLSVLFEMGRGLDLDLRAGRKVPGSQSVGVQWTPEEEATIAAILKDPWSHINPRD